MKVPYDEALLQKFFKALEISSHDSQSTINQYAITTAGKSLSTGRMSFSEQRIREFERFVKDIEDNFPKEVAEQMLRKVAARVESGVEAEKNNILKETSNDVPLSNPLAKLIDAEGNNIALPIRQPVSVNNISKPIINWMDELKIKVTDYFINDISMITSLKESARACKLYLQATGSMIFDEAVPDGFLIDLCRNIPDINEIVFLGEGRDSLLRKALSCHRTQLSEYLIQQGADVNFRSDNGIPVCRSVLMIKNTDIQLFELLVKSGRLIKDEGMELFKVKFGDHSLKLSDCYDIFTWKYNTLKTIFEGLQNRTDADNRSDFFTGLVCKVLGEPLSLKSQSLEILKSLYTKCFKEIISEFKTYSLEHPNETGLSPHSVDLFFDLLEKGKFCEVFEEPQVEIMGAEGESV